MDDELKNHEIDYKIYGDDMQFVEVELDPDETVVAEAGSLMMMDDAIRMETIFGDGSNQNGGGLMGKLMGAGKKNYNWRKLIYDYLYK